MIKGIVFDIDGTLLNHEQALQISLTNLYSLLREKIPHSNFEEFLLTWKIKTDKYINDYLDGRITFEEQRILRVQNVCRKWNYNLTPKKALNIFKIYHTKYEQNWILYEDVLPCLTRLKNYSLGIISDGEGEQQRRKLAFTEIDSFFTSIIISGEVSIRKPNPSLFKMSAKELNLALDEILYVGDLLENDALGALNAGMHGVLINRSGSIHDESNILQISKLTELPNIIETFRD
ncbi:MAG: HAD family hydrolase [Candidatus Heimdallarchaeota archaeon]|nr:MAG: HAD family hydrolase [Candidatus Heimdallarchaeota archaeon]